jgi:hypothetical protein
MAPETKDENPGGAGADDWVSIELQLTAALCSGCGEPRETGRCPECGSEVPVSEEVAEIAAARGAALAGLPERLEEIAAGFERLPQGSIPLSNDQFATAVTDAELFDLTRSLLTLGEELEALDVNDPAVIGRGLRQLVEARIARAKKLLEACRELEAFDPHGPAIALQDYAVRTGRFGVRLTQRYLGVLMATSIPEVREAESQMQGMLNEFRELNGVIPALLDEMEEWVLRDVDARISLVLGKAGVYTDELGNVDVAAVLGAFAATDRPYELLAERSHRYFRHLIGNSEDRDVALESLLIFSAIAIGSLDRPLGALRIAAGVLALLRDAAAADPAKVQELVDHTMSEGALVFAANERIRRGFQLLCLAEAAGEAVEDDVVRTVMDAYKELAEGAYRTYGWLFVQLARLRDGQTAEERDLPPMLGELTERLDALPDERMQRFAAGSDSALRNAVAHAQYRWESEENELIDLRTGERWDREALEAAGEALVGAAIGADAGYGCFLASGTVDLKAPPWIREGHDPRIYAPMAQASFGALGFEVIEVRDGGATVVIVAPQAFDRMRLFGPLFGFASVVSRPTAFRVVSEGGEVLIDVDAAAFAEAREAGQAVRDLASLAPLISDRQRRGAAPERALARTLAIQLSLVIGVEGEAMESGGLSAASMLRLADRLQFVLGFVRARVCPGDDSLRTVLRSVSRARALATAASQGVESAPGELAEELLALLRWAHEEGTSWPTADLVGSSLDDEALD